MKKIEGYSAVLAVKDLQESLSFFVEKLGFMIKSSYGDPMYIAEVRRDETESISLLHQPKVEVRRDIIATFAFRCSDIDSLYQELLSRGVVMDEELDNKAYGMREFRIKDPNGYVFYFQEKITAGS